MSKPDDYQRLAAELQAVIEGEPDAMANAANAAAILFHGLEQLNWAGFYFLKASHLVLGPFQGKVACTRIPLGRGVCGTAAVAREAVVVADVHQFPGHIACDAASQAEIVVPLVKDGRLLGVLDLDSPLPGRFDDEDRAGLELFAAVLLKEWLVASG
jgi:L-methionine (R)-S-oxide reductase